MLLVSVINVSYYKQLVEKPLMLTPSLKAVSKKTKTEKKCWNFILQLPSNGEIMQKWENYLNFVCIFLYMQPFMWFTCNSCSSKWCDYSQQCLVSLLPNSYASWIYDDNC